jgi:hypothetical protein
VSALHRPVPCYQQEQRSPYTLKQDDEEISPLLPGQPFQRGRPMSAPSGAVLRIAASRAAVAVEVE